MPTKRYLPAGMALGLKSTVIPPPDGPAVSALNVTGLLGFTGLLDVTGLSDVLELSDVSGSLVLCHPSIDG